MDNYKKTETKAFSSAATIGQSFYVKGTEVWVVNTTYYTRTIAKHQSKLKQELKQELKAFIPITTDLYTLNRFSIGDESSLEALFKILHTEMTESNADSLEKIAALLGIPFNKDAYQAACKEKVAKELLQVARIRRVLIPRWVKNFNPFIYAQLKILNSKHKKVRKQ